MTLNKHLIQGLPVFKSKTTSSKNFEELMTNAGYFQIGCGVGQANRIKLWWSHDYYPLVEATYSPDKKIVITAYHITT